MQRVEEQRAKHVQIEQELNELHRRKFIDLEEKYEHSLSAERDEHEHRIQTLLNQLDQMKNELEHLQSTTMTERQDLARKLQDVFETALFKGSAKVNRAQSNITNAPVSPLPIAQSKSNNSVVVDAQRKGLTMSNTFVFTASLNGKRRSTRPTSTFARIDD